MVRSETENFSTAHRKYIRSHKMCVCLCVILIITVLCVCACVRACSALIYAFDTKIKWKRLFYIYCLISWKYILCASLCVSHTLCECLILNVKWFYAILIICVNEYEYLLGWCIAYAIKLSLSYDFKISDFDFCCEFEDFSTRYTFNFMHIFKNKNACVFFRNFVN